MTPVVQLLLAANVIGFFLQMTVGGITRAFAFVPVFVLSRPWTIVTYMFLHGGLMHIAFNMLALFFFGPRVEDRIGSRRFAILYFLSGITGAVVSLLFTPTASIIGASAGVFGVMLAFARYWPDAPILVWGILPVPARMMVIFQTIIALYSGIQGAGGGIAHFAHLGGYLGAWLYLKWTERGRGAFKRQLQAVSPAAARRVEAWRSIDMSRIHEVNRDEVNRILDKISASGLASLSPQERLFLSNFVPLDDRTPPVS